jgi:hypothetical protein
VNSTLSAPTPEAPEVAPLKRSASKIGLKLLKHNAKAVRRALKHHRLKAKITVTIKDTANNQTVKKLTIKFKH